MQAPGEGLDARRLSYDTVWYEYLYTFFTQEDATTCENLFRRYAAVVALHAL